MKLCYITWHDAHADAWQWTEISEVGTDGPYVVLSAGWLLEDDNGGKPGHVSIAQSFTCDEHVDSVIHIPQAMVVGIRTFDDIEAKDEQANHDQSGSIPGSPLSETSKRSRVGGRDGSPRPDRKDRKNRYI